MNRRFVPTVLVLCLLPSVVYAQRIPVWFAAAALSPIVMLILAALLGWLYRSWRVGLAHGGALLVWVGLWILAAYSVTNDYVIWTPLAIYALHSLSILSLLIQRLCAGTD